MSERPVVVLGLLWAGLAVARSLGRAGVPVTGKKRIKLSGGGSGTTSAIRSSSVSDVRSSGM